MHSLLLRAIRTAALSLLGLGLVCAQDWKTTDAYAGVDLGGLSPAQKATVLKLLRTQGCTCGCEMKLAQCRVEDPRCAYSKALSNVIAQAIKSGKSEADALAAAKDSPFAHPPEPPPLLEAPVSVPVAGAPVTGPANAAITLVEFSDFQCPYCAVATPQIEAILKAYPKQIKLIFKEFPLIDSHPQAAMAATAAVAAFRQNKFWEMHDALFAHSSELSRPTVLLLAKQLGLDMNRLESDMNSDEIHKAILQDMQDGDNLHVAGTPSLFINGRHYNGPISVEALKPILEDQLKSSAAKTQTAVQ